MRFYSIVLVSTLLGGCASNRSEQDVFSTYFKAFKLLSEDYQLSPQQIAMLPYATLRVSVNSGTYALMPLGYLNGNIQKWYSQDLFGITTQNGRIIQIYNSETEVSKIQQSAIWSKIQLAKIGYNQELFLPIEMDFLTLRRIGVKASVTIKGEGVEERSIMGKSVKLFKISEKVNIPSMDFTYENYYWKDPASNFIWESVQKWGPNVPEIHYQVVKPWKAVQLPL